MRKKRILIVNEASWLNTGYSNYGQAILNRLNSTGKYEIAEIACYAKPNDPRIDRAPWKVYANMPDDNNPAELEYFQSNTLHQFGSWQFEKYAIDFKPDIVFAIRDWVMDEFLERSPFRPYYHLCLMPTVDSIPQHPQWISTYMNADSILTYSDWGLSVLNEYNGLIKTVGVASPGNDLEVFKPTENKKQLKVNFGLKPDDIVVGTVMRNQIRKLYPDLIKSFRLFLDRAPASIAEKSYLYMHTSYPDWWDIPGLIMESGISHRCLFTYKCQACNFVFMAHFRDARTTCKRCNRSEAFIPNSHIGVERQHLATIYNLFDVYVQYSNCLAAGSKIQTKAGWKNIEDISVGEIVLTHTGKYQKVLKAFKNPINKKPLEISVCSDYEKLIITQEHPVYAIAKKDYKPHCKNSVRECLGDDIRYKREFPKLKFTEMSELKPGDLIGYYIDDYVKDIRRIDLLENCPTNTILVDDDKYYTKSHPSKIYNRYISVDSDFCRFIGLYVADGTSSIKNGLIAITSHSREIINQKLACDIFDKFSSTPATVINLKTRRNFNAILTLTSSKIHAKYIAENCSKGINKKLPNWSLNLPLDKQKEIIIGLFMGDGHYIKKLNTSVYVTISEKLAAQIKHILRRLRIDFNVRLVQKDGNRQPQYRFEVCGNVAKGDFFTKRTNTKNLYHQNYHLIQISNISENDYNDYVYNIEVENDNSYQSKIGIMHNCGGFEMPCVEAASCGVHPFAVDYSAMEDFKRTVKATPVKVLHFNREGENGTDKAVPDNNDFVDKLIKFLELPETWRAKKGMDARKGVEARYDWDKTAKVWENHFDSIEVKDTSSTWFSPLRQHVPVREIPYNLSVEDFVNWAIVNIAGREDLLNNYMVVKLVRDLQWQSTTEKTSNISFNDLSAMGTRPKRKNYSREDAIAELRGLSDYMNYWENRRWNELVQQKAEI